MTRFFYLITLITALSVHLSASNIDTILMSKQNLMPFADQTHVTTTDIGLIVWRSSALGTQIIEIAPNYKVDFIKRFNLKGNYPYCIANKQYIQFFQVNEKKRFIAIASIDQYRSKKHIVYHDTMFWDEGTDVLAYTVSQNQFHLLQYTTVNRSVTHLKYVANSIRPEAMTYDLSILNLPNEVPFFKQVQSKDVNERGEEVYRFKLNKKQIKLPNQSLPVEFEVIHQNEIRPKSTNQRRILFQSNIVRLFYISDKVYQVTLTAQTGKATYQSTVIPVYPLVPKDAVIQKTIPDQTIHILGINPEGFVVPEYVNDTIKVHQLNFNGATLKTLKAPDQNLVSCSKEEILPSQNTLFSIDSSDFKAELFKSEHQFVSLDGNTFTVGYIIPRLPKIKIPNKVSNQLKSLKIKTSSSSENFKAFTNDKNWIDIDEIELFVQQHDLNDFAFMKMNGRSTGILFQNGYITLIQAK